MIGVDNSEEMLEIAREAEYEADAWDETDESEELTEPEKADELCGLEEPEGEKEPCGPEEPEDEKEPCGPEEPVEPEELTEPADRGILYLLEDMRELELYGSVRAVVSVCDSMNYILGLLLWMIFLTAGLPGAVKALHKTAEHKHRQSGSESEVYQDNTDRVA